MLALMVEMSLLMAAEVSWGGGTSLIGRSPPGLFNSIFGTAANSRGGTNSSCVEMSGISICGLATGMSASLGGGGGVGQGLAFDVSLGVCKAGECPIDMDLRA